MEHCDMGNLTQCIGHVVEGDERYGS
jgi:hypothetical protein